MKTGICLTVKEEESNISVMYQSANAIIILHNKSHKTQWHTTTNIDFFSLRSVVWLGKLCLKPQTSLARIKASNWLTSTFLFIFLGLALPGHVPFMASGRSPGS